MPAQFLTMHGLLNVPAIWFNVTPSSGTNIVTIFYSELRCVLRSLKLSFNGSRAGCFCGAKRVVDEIYATKWRPETCLQWLRPLPNLVKTCNYGCQWSKTLRLKSHNLHVHMSLDEATDPMWPFSMTSKQCPSLWLPLQMWLRQTKATCPLETMCIFCNEHCFAGNNWVFAVTFGS